MESLNRKLKNILANAERLMEEAAIQAGKNIGAGIWTVETAQFYLTLKARELGLD
jgi:hypothetical protein